MNENKIQEKYLDFQRHKYDTYGALKFIVDLYLHDIYPFMQSLLKYQQLRKNNQSSEDTVLKTRNIFILCCDQMKKCFINFLDVMRVENREGVCIQDSRLCILERISWCYEKLLSIQEQLSLKMNDTDQDDSNNSLLLDSMYFVNWVDQTFDILSKLSDIVYKMDNKDSLVLEKRKEDLVECVSGLHTSVDELLLSAMTLCKYCLPSDQVIVKARCQVVLRETKALLTDLLTGDLDAVQATIDNLKLPIMPSNINVLIDVLKDVLYALETNTNTALLALLVNSFSYNESPVDVLRNHTCMCEEDKCMIVRDFDMYNERLMQIGTFAMSCSCDERRILGIRSGLASLEALDPHLVPALMLSPSSHHATTLVNIWHQEVGQIRDNVFLIVDPSAFADKAKQMMHQALLEIIKTKSYDNSKSCEVINIGCLVYEFFDVYNKHEPDALSHNDKLQPLLMDLYKAQMECKIVSNSLCSINDFVYDIKKKDINISFDSFVKRLKLLYTIVKRIYLVLNPKENEDEFYEEQENNTYTVNVKNTYIASPKINITRSLFARTHTRTNSRRFPLAILTKHLKAKKDLSFSIKLDEMCNLSEIKKVRESSILYHPKIKTRSLRKAVLSKQLMPEKTVALDVTRNLDKDSFMDETMNLQITDVLNQLNDLTNSMAMRRPFNSTTIDKTDTNKLTIAINMDTSKYVSSVSVNTMDLSQPSDVNTLERISDLDLVESKLSSLKFGHIETSL